MLTLDSRWEHHDDVVSAICNFQQNYPFQRLHAILFMKFVHDKENSYSVIKGNNNSYCLLSFGTDIQGIVGSEHFLN